MSDIVDHKHHPLYSLIIEASHMLFYPHQITQATHRVGAGNTGQAGAENTQGRQVQGTHDRCREYIVHMQRIYG